MVEFHKDGFSLHVYTGCSPSDEWLRLHRELMWMMSMMDMDNVPNGGLVAVCSLVDSMMPGWKEAHRLGEGAESECPVDKDGV